MFGKQIKVLELKEMKKLGLLIIALVITLLAYLAGKYLTGCQIGITVR